MSDLSAIEQIAQGVEAWGEGWKFLYNPDDRGKRARIVRPFAENIDIEIEIVDEPGSYGVFLKTDVFNSAFGWATVSCNTRNERTRKALDYINAELDAMEQEDHTDA